MQITQSFTLSRTEVAAYRESATQAIELLKPLVAKVNTHEHANTKGDLLIEMLKESITVDVKVANSLSNIAYMLRVKDDVEVTLSISIDDVVFSELMAYGVDLLKDYMGILNSLVDVAMNLKQLVQSKDLSSTRRMVALKERMGKDQVTVKVNDEIKVDDTTESESSENTSYKYPYWFISEAGSAWSIEEIGVDSGVVDIKERMIEISLARPGTLIQLSASARVRLTVRDGEVVKSRQFKEFYHVDDDTVVEATIFDSLTPASHDGMGNFKTK